MYKMHIFIPRISCHWIKCMCTKKSLPPFAPFLIHSSLKQEVSNLLFKGWVKSWNGVILLFPKWYFLCTYWVTQKLPQIYTAIHTTFPIQIRKITVQICGNFWVTQYSKFELQFLWEGKRHRNQGLYINYI